jgi:sodium-dependent dicarboxylate transporter 2/3/5
MTKAERAELVGRELDRLYPETPVPLDHRDPYTLLVAVLLSAQCTDARVNLVTPGLFARAATPEAMMEVPVEEIRELIRPCGLSPQKSVAIAFAITVFLWVLPGVLLILLGDSHPICGWLSKRLPEGVVALIGAILLFLLPGNRDADGRLRRALEWREARIDWDIVLLYGGGMALGELCFSTGLAGAIGQSITGWIPAGDWSGPVLVAVATVVAVVTSEFTSNTASANMVVPVVIALARATGVDPLMAALAATFASSLGFMMPVSTPCNAIVYGSGRVPLRSMMASGAIIDVVGAITVTAAMLLASRF